MKSKRAQSVDDDETWLEGGVCPTLNAFDSGDTRTTVIVFGFNWQNGGGYGNANPGLGITEDGTGPLSTSQVPAVASRQQVRRLTPVECERLQGFPTIFEWSDDMTRDELSAALLAAGHITVDVAAGKVYRHRGPGGKAVPAALVEGSNVNGYLAGNFQLASTKKQIRLHRIVWIAANGIPEEGMAVCHRDNDKTNNAITNLYLATPEQNSADAHRDGLIPHAEKLTARQRQELVFDYREGAAIQDLLVKYGIGRSRTYQIIREANWTAGQADTHRYKQCGNAVTVNVANYVACLVNMAVGSDHGSGTV